jgi:hypothetical protein
MKKRPSTACRRTVSGAISLPSPGCFSPFPHGTSSLSVASTYLALEDGPPSFPRGFTCPAVLGNCLQRDRHVSRTGLSPSSVVLSRNLPLRERFVDSPGYALRQPHNPACISTDGLGFSPFARHYSGNLCLISTPRGTEMFHFPPLAFRTYEFSTKWCRISSTGLPHSEISGSKPA